MACEFGGHNPDWKRSPEPGQVSGEDDAERHEPPKEDVLDGIERMPEALLRLLHGQELRQANREDPLKLVPPA